MAQVPNVLPDVRPEGRTPDDYQHVQANPNEFGAQIGQGAEKLGAGVTKATDFFGEIAADQSNFNATDEGTKLLHGDPNKKVLGPDGTMIPDTGFFGKKNQDMMESRDATVQQLQDIIKKHREDLGLNSSQLQYDRDTRRWLQLQESRIGEAYDKASTGWALDVNNMGKKQTSDDISRDADNDAAFGNHLDKLKSWYVKDAHVQGLGNEGAKQGLIDATKSAWETRINTIGVHDPKRAEQLTDEHRDELGDAWPQFASKFKVAAAKADVVTGTDAAWNSTFNAPQARATGDYGHYTRYNQFLNNGDIKSALRFSEDVRTEPYWDQAKFPNGQPAGPGHWAIGVGSHFLTHEDGTSEELGGANGSNPHIRPNVKLTREDVERDLDKQSNNAVKLASEKVGEAWRGMTQGQHAALTSIVYNYGHLPTDIEIAAKSGDMKALSDAILTHAGDNAGVNRDRRRAEAGAVLGGQQQVAHTEEGITSTPANYTTTPTTTATGTGYIPSPYESPTPEEETPEQTVDRLTIAKNKALAQALLDNPDWDDAQQREAEVRLNSKLQLAVSVANQSTHDRKVHKDAVSDQMFDFVNKGKIAEAFAVIDTASGLRPEERFNMREALTKLTGHMSSIDAGPGFTDAEGRVGLPVGDPNRLGIGSRDEIFQMYLNNQLTDTGMKRIIDDINFVAKTPDEAADILKKAEGLRIAKMEITKEDELTGTKPDNVDPKLQIAREKAFQRYQAAYLDEYTQYKEGKVKEFKYFDPNEAEKLKETSYPLRQRLHDELVAGGGATTGGTAPAGIDPNSWTTVMSNPPIVDNQFTGPKKWASAVKDLLDDPSPQNMADFDRNYKGNGGNIEAATIVQALHKPFEMTVSGVPQQQPSEDLGLKTGQYPIDIFIKKLFSVVASDVGKVGHGAYWPGRDLTDAEKQSVETVKRLYEENSRPEP